MFGDTLSFSLLAFPKNKYMIHDINRAAKDLNSSPSYKKKKWFQNVKEKNEKKTNKNN